MSVPPIELLRRRFERLDSSDTLFDDLAKDLRQFIRIVSTYYEGSMGPAGWALIAADEADNLALSSRLLSRISRDDPLIADGPLHRREQIWMVSTRAGPPAESKFVAPTRRRDAPASAHHLRGGGLYTSTPSRTGVSMWELYVDVLQPQMPSRPLDVWELTVSDRPVMEIGSARDWVGLVDLFPRVVDGLVYPDWRECACAYAGVHITARAVVSTQGVSFNSRHGTTAPPFWDVEQTVWFHWVFDSARFLRRHE